MSDKTYRVEIESKALQCTIHGNYVSEPNGGNEPDVMIGKTVFIGSYDELRKHFNSDLIEEMKTE